MFWVQKIRGVGEKIGQVRRGEDGKGMRGVSTKRIRAARGFKIISSLVGTVVKNTGKP
jgi:hypothetical protein